MKLLYNANIHTLDGLLSHASAILIAGGRIIASMQLIHAPSDMFAADRFWIGCTGRIAESIFWTPCCNYAIARGRFALR